MSVCFGFDVSNYQAGIDMARAAAEGHEFVFAKVTQGATYRSPAWPAQRDGASKAGLLLAGYHYIDTSDPAAQAANCRAWLGDPSIPIMVDWEAQGGTWANCLAVIAALRSVGLRVVLGYFPAWYAAQQGGPHLADAGVAWVSSRYPSTATGTPAQIYGRVTEATWAAYGGVAPTILQFTDRATIAGMSPVDADAFLGSREQLAQLLYPTVPAPVPAPSSTLTKGFPEVIDRQLVKGANYHRIVCPVGKASGIVSAAYVSVSAAGGVNGQIAFQKNADSDGAPPGAGPIWHFTARNANRLYTSIPDGTEYLEVWADAGGSGAVLVELFPK